MPFLKCLYGRTLNLSTTSILYFYGKNVYPFIPEYKTTCFMFYKTPTQQTLTYSTMLAITETVSHLQPPSSDDPRVIHGACPRSHLSKGLVAPLVSRWRGREKKKPHSRVVFSEPVRIVHDESEILGDVFDIISWWNYSWNPLITGVVDAVRC